MLLESWIQDPAACCEKCGVTTPVVLLTGNGPPVVPCASDAAAVDSQDTSDTLPIAQIVVSFSGICYSAFHNILFVLLFLGRAISYMNVLRYSKVIFR